MSLHDLLTQRPKITGSLNFSASDTVDSVATTNDLSSAVGPILFSFSSLPDITIGNTSNNILSPKTGTTVTIPGVAITLSVPGFSGLDLTSTTTSFVTTAVSFDVANTDDDFLAGFGGADQVFGHSGNDVLLGDGLKPNDDGSSDGSDTLDGGSGNDVLIGGGLGDSLSGGSGNDFILGDYFLGIPISSIPINLNRNVYSDSGSGGSIFAGGSFNASVNVVFNATLEFGSGNEGNDTIFGGDGNDVVFADKGNDVVNGDAGNDILFGNANNDILNGGTGNDTIFGDTLAPNFSGADGSDSINGDDGNDLLIGGGLGDVVNGGAGQDIIFGDYFLGFISGSIPLKTPPFNIPLNIPVLPGDTSANISITLLNSSLPIGSGNEGNDALSGGDDDDIIFADKGQDTLNGDGGADILVGGAGADTVNGGIGNDILLGDFLAPNFLGGLDGNDFLNSGAGDDFALGGGGSDSILGGDGTDILFGDYLLGFLTGSLEIPLGELPDGFTVSPSGPKPDTLYLPIGGNGGNDGNDTIRGG
jgi:Ca2+-binding RTX toxin-like protein